MPAPVHRLVGIVLDTVHVLPAAADVMNRWSTSAEFSTSPPGWILASTLG
jgi:hypothetical protein